MNRHKFQITTDFVCKILSNLYSMRRKKKIINRAKKLFVAPSHIIKNVTQMWCRTKTNTSEKNLSNKAGPLRKKKRPVNHIGSLQTN